MVTAMAYPDKEKGGRGKKSSKIEEFSVASGYVSQARYVLRNNLIPEGQQYPDRCLAVMAGSALQVSPTRAREHLDNVCTPSRHGVYRPTRDYFPVNHQTCRKPAVYRASKAIIQDNPHYHELICR